MRFKRYRNRFQNNFVLKDYYKILLLLILMQLCVLQTIVAQDTTFVNSNAEIPDTVIVITQPQTKIQNTAPIINIKNTPVPVQTKSVVIRKGDPMKATMLSVVFPGGGQIYNRKYWKLPIVYAGFGALFYAINFNSDNHQKYYKAYMDFTDDIKETDSYIKLISLDPEKYKYDPVLYPDSYNSQLADKVEGLLFSYVDSYKRYRDLSFILTGAWYILQILDANVDASLMNYNVNDNLELTLAPKMFNMPGLYPFAGLNFGFTLTF